MQFEEKNKEFVAFLNELEIDNNFMARKVIKWLKEQSCFNYKKYACVWQTVENARIFHDKRGYVPESSFKNRVCSKFAIRSGNTTYYFAVFEVSDKEIIVDYILNNSGYLFFLNEEKHIKAFCKELESDMKNKYIITDKLIFDMLSKAVGKNEGYILSFEDFDDQKGNFTYRFSLL